jgi:hypothetical protein
MALPVYRNYLGTTPSGRLGRQARFCVGEGKRMPSVGSSRRRSADAASTTPATNKGDAMYYQERIVDGYRYIRTQPNGEWRCLGKVGPQSMPEAQ